MKWTTKEKDLLLGFCIASDEENNTEHFKYVSDMLIENGIEKTPSQCKSMYYRLMSKIKKNNNHEKLCSNYQQPTGF